MKKVYLVSVSGGKDSQAAWIWMLNNYKNKKIVAYTADTGWEHEDTYNHLDYLENRLGKLIRIKSKKYNGFEDMCIKRKGFPNRLGRFCTDELKIIPSNDFIKEWQNKGYKVINITGVRRDESKTKKLLKPVLKNGIKWWFVPKRDIESKWKTSFLGKAPTFTKRKDGTIRPPSKNAIKEYYSKSNSVTVMQPIIDFTTRDVLEYNITNGTKNNPLYSKGFTRVGCMPCIMASTKEIGLLPANYAKRVYELEKKVQSVNKKNKPVFFHKGGKLTDFETYYKKYKYNTLDFDLGCINELGICE